MKNKANVFMPVLLATSFALSAVLFYNSFSTTPVLAASFFSPGSPSNPNLPAETPVFQPTPTPQIIEPLPVMNTPVQVPNLPVFQPPFRPPLTVPTDVTSSNPNLTTNNSNSFNVGSPVAGVQSAKSFPSMDELGGSPDFILVNGADSSYTRESPYLVHLINGTILVSVHRPSSLGMLTTPLGEVSFNANSDAFVAYEDGVLRIRNVDGMKQSVKVHMDKGPFAGTNSHAYTIAPGYELVLSDHKLASSEMRPKDGILRRQSQAIDEGYGAVSQFHVQTALQASAVIPKMVAAESDAKVKRVLGDMSRMAAVLNHVNGGNGYSQ